MGWLSILPVFLLQLQVNGVLLEPSFAFRLIFCLYQPVLVQTFCTSLPVLTRPCNSGGSSKYWLIGTLICFWYHTFLIWGISFKICIDVLFQCINVQVHNLSRIGWFRRGPINWISISWNFPSGILHAFSSYLLIFVEIELHSYIVCGIV